ncbi:MAG: hypothetical protein AAFO75_04335, partial [Pseudomonadota bacterium]
MIRFIKGNDTAKFTPTLAFGQLTAFYDVPTAVQQGITSITENVFLVMLLIGIFYIFIGTFMES